jgi:tetratricopeptide (TPR) repeat protein
MATAKESELATRLGLRHDPEPLRFLAEAGFLWLDLMRPEPAEAIFNALVTLAPNDPTGYVGLADVRRRNGDVSGALSQLDKAARAPHADALALATIFRKQGEMHILLKKAAAAEKAFAKVVQIAPDGPEAEVARAYVEALNKPHPAAPSRTP